MTSDTIALVHPGTMIPPSEQGDGARGEPVPHSLSPRQREVAVRIAQGMTNQEIAEELGIDVSTVDNHRRAVYNKLNVRNAVELTHRMILHGYVRVKGMRGRPRKPITG